MPKNKRRTVGDRRYAAKYIKVEPSEGDNESQNVMLEELGRETKQFYTFETLTQTEDMDGDHLYAKRCEEMETDTMYEAETDTTLYESVKYELINHDSCNNSDSEIEVEVEDVTVTVESVQFKTLASDIRKCVSQRDYCIRETENDITMIKFYISDSLSVKYTVQLDSCFICKVFVHRKLIKPSHSLWIDLPRLFTSVDSILKLLDRLETMNVCSGNLNVEFQTLVPIGAVLTSNTDTAVLAYREGDFGAISAIGEKYSSTIRSSKCEMITNRKLRCVSCVNYGFALTKRLKRLENRKVADRKFNHSTFKHKDMTRKELCRKLSEQKEEIDDLQVTVSKLKRKVDNGIRENGLCSIR